jgi:hypothetical protein
MHRLLARDPEAIAYAVERSCINKAEVRSTCGGEACLQGPAHSQQPPMKHDSWCVVDVTAIPKSLVCSQQGPVMVPSRCFPAWKWRGRPCPTSGHCRAAGLPSHPHRCLLCHICGVASQVVAADERETNDVRATLNLGHTFGHAIETGTGYGALLHGEAVSIGMVMAADMSYRLVRWPHQPLSTHLSGQLQVFWHTARCKRQLCRLEAGCRQPWHIAMASALHQFAALLLTCCH